MDAKDKKEEPFSFGIVHSKEKVDETLRKMLQEQDENKKVDLPQESYLDSFIILPGRKHGTYEYPDLLVSMERTNYGNIKWKEAHFKLAEENSFMLVPRQLFDFIELLKKGPAFDGKGQKIDTKNAERVLAGLMGVSRDKEQEFFDMQFKDINGSLYIHSDHTIINEKLIPSRIEKLEECVMKESYIDFLSMNHQGMPTKKGRDIKYAPPKDGCIVGLHNTEYPAIFCCGSCNSCHGQILPSCVRQVKIR